MTTHWSTEPAARGDGVWFVAEDDDQIQAFAAPGVWLPSPRVTGVHESSLRRWRRASWALHNEPVLDRDAPAETFAVTTAEVCNHMPSALRAQVRELMLNQLYAASCLGQIGRGLVDDDTAHAGAAATTWVLSELRTAFPDEVWQPPASAVELHDIPAMSDELLASMPRPRANRPRHTEAESPEPAELLRMLLAELLRALADALLRLAERFFPRRQQTTTDPGHPSAETRAEEVVG